MSELTYWKNPATGLIEGVDILGTVKVVQRNPNLQFSSKPGCGFEERFTESGESYYVEEGLRVEDEPYSWRYTSAMAGAIASSLTEGLLLIDICKAEWCPPFSVVTRWLRMRPDFKEMIEIAKRDRVEHFYEGAIKSAREAVMNSSGKEYVAAKKLEVETMRWIAEKGDASRFATKQVHSLDVLTQVVVHTGIDRNEKEVAEIGSISDTSISIGELTNGEAITEKQ